MGSNGQCSAIAKSELSGLFAKRSGVPFSSPADVMESLAAGLRRKRRHAGGPVMEIGPFLVERNVLEFEVTRGLSCDGYLEPRGTSFSDGFKMVIRHDAYDERLRFTIAHELCHTFFYEFVPELKFSNHKPDSNEETLCNLGAAAFLMPAAGLRRRAAEVSVGLESLETLAREYGVSIPAMFLRLRGLGAWKCELSVWVPSIDGTFRLQKIYGGKTVDWQWSDASIPRFAWESHKLRAGRTILEHFDERQVRFVELVSYQLARRGERLVALCGKLSKCAPKDLPCAIAKMGDRELRPTLQLALPRRPVQAVCDATDMGRTRVRNEGMAAT